jgi:ABC-type sugar transport system ATPase subunit
MRAIFGLDPHANGQVYVAGKPAVIKKPSDAIDAGIALVPESRKEHGLIMNQSFRFNAMLAVLKRYIHGIGIDNHYEEETLNTYIKSLSIKLKNVDQQVKHLSGGNQQKVVLAKWLATMPKILIFDEPTRGIDVGAKHEIYKLIAELARQGMAIIFISSELNEVLGLSDNIVVLCEGKQTGFLTRDQINEDTVIRHAMGGTL